LCDTTKVTVACYKVCNYELAILRNKVRITRKNQNWETKSCSFIF